MARVVKLVSSGSYRGRLQVNLDDGSVLELAGILAIGLASGQELTAQDQETLKQRDRAEVVYERVLNLLSSRPRSEGEIKHYLANKEVDRLTSEEVLARLTRAGLVDDKAFASYWVENREAFHPRGKWALRSELFRAGVATEIIENAVSVVDDEAGAFRAAERKAYQMRSCDDQDFRRRLLSFLQRRGYSYNVADRVIRSLRKQVTADEAKES
jgi:regulatory protein